MILLVMQRKRIKIFSPPWIITTKIWRDFPHQIDLTYFTTIAPQLISMCI